jgi:hypothetical protein
MIFNKHSNLQGQHAFLSASKYHWINYDPDKLASVFATSLAAQKGTELHLFASEAIRLGIKLPRSSKTLNQYVNDAIGFRMSPEQILYYSNNAFGTADAISFRNNILRIHDLKTGVTLGSPHQLEVYAALFCLEYGVKPFDIEMDLRIYQNDDIERFDTEPGVIVHIMDKIIAFDKIIESMRAEAS